MSKIQVCKPDYRTSYARSHAWIAPVGQNFDIRAEKAIDKAPKRAKSSLAQEIDRLTVDHFKTDYVRNFPQRACSKNPDQMVKPSMCDTINYVTTFEHKLIRNPPPPIMPFESEMKEAYTPKPLPQHERTVFPPNPYSMCPMKAFGRDEQPPLIPAEPGFMKHLDIYLSTTRADYLPFTIAQQRGIARKDIVTFYDSAGVPRGGKGYGPKEDTKIEPLTTTKKPEYNKKMKKVKNPMQTIPHRGFSTEYKEVYQSHTKSEMEPYSDLLAVATFPPVSQSPWQNLCAPSMYCTESCHIGTGHPVNATIEITPEKKVYRHTIGCKC